VTALPAAAVRDATRDAPFDGATGSKAAASDATAAAPAAAARAAAPAVALGNSDNDVSRHDDEQRTVAVEAATRDDVTRQAAAAAAAGVAGPVPKNGGRGIAWISEEALCAAKGWGKTTVDPIHGTSKTRQSFWEKMVENTRDVLKEKKSSLTCKNALRGRTSALRRFSATTSPKPFTNSTLAWCRFTNDD